VLECQDELRDTRRQYIEREYAHKTIMLQSGGRGMTEGAQSAATRRLHFVPPIGMTDNVMEGFSGSEYLSVSQTKEIGLHDQHKLWKGKSAPSGGHGGHRSGGGGHHSSGQQHSPQRRHHSSGQHGNAHSSPARKAGSHASVADMHAAHGQKPSASLKSIDLAMYEQLKGAHNMLR
jgi:hypothetical protein